VKNIKEYALANEKGTLTYLPSHAIDDRTHITLYEEVGVCLDD
jgi:hypothetical protein